MSSPVTVGGFPDVLDIRYDKIANGAFSAVEDRRKEFYTIKAPTQYTMRMSELTPIGLHSDFNGMITYDGPDQGYDSYASPKEKSLGEQIERLLLEYDKFDIIDGKFSRLGRSAGQTKQVDAARVFNQAFNNDATWYTHTEGIALCGSHTTTRSGVSTASGFSNVSTAALSPTSLRSAYVTFRQFRDKAGQYIDGNEADLLLVPVALKDRATEIIGTMKGLDDATQNKNVLEGRYSVKDWIYLSDTNNWFLINSSEMKKNLIFYEKVAKEFERMKDFDTKVAKYSSYMVYHILRGPAWQWILGHNVS